MTTTENTFLAAILADPEDDLPRLVYADWIEERGRAADVARAEFIRAGCELAKLEATLSRPFEDQDLCTEVSDNWCPVCGDCCCPSPEDAKDDSRHHDDRSLTARKAALVARHDALLKKWCERWSPRPSRVVGAMSSGASHELEFARGFPDVLTIRLVDGADVVLPFVRGCLQAAPIREVRWRVQVVETGQVDNWSLRIWRGSSHWHLQAQFRPINQIDDTIWVGSSRREAIHELVQRLWRVQRRVQADPQMT